MKPRDFTLLTPKEMCGRISCSLRTLQNLKCRRLIPHIKLGRLVRYDPIAVQEALEKLTVKEHA